MRRTTLGSVSQSGLNSRASGAQRRPNPRPTTTIKPGDERRQSAFPSYGGSSRRVTNSKLTDRRATSTAIVSAAGHRGSRLSSRPSMTYSNRPTMRSDPRPLHDKHYMQQCVKALISFVIDRGYDQPISPKILTNPSSRDFQHIFLFLVRRVDPTFDFLKRFEDEVPQILRALGYPFSISKSALSAVGSPHTWPSLLGVLTWLMGLLKYDEAREARNNDVELDPLERRQKMFYDNFVKAYHQFLSGADTFPELDAELQQHFEAENSRRESEIAKLEADREKLAATLEALQTQPSPLELATEHRVSLETNIHKFELLIPSLIEHNTNVKKKCKEKEEEIAKEEAELTAHVAEKERLLQTLASQEEAGIDSARIVADRERLRERLARLATERSQAENSQRAVEQQLASSFARLQDSHRKYQKLTAMLEMSASQSSETGTGRGRRGRRQSQRKDFEWDLTISQDAAVTDADKMLSKNIEKDILPHLKKLKDQLSGYAPEMQEERLALQERIDEVEEQLIVKRSEISLLESRKSNLEADYKKQRAAMAEMLEDRKRDILQKEEQVRNSQHAVRRAADNLRRVQDMHRSTKEAIERKRKELVEIANKDIETLRRHHQGVKAGVLRAHQFFEREGTYPEADASSD